MNDVRHILITQTTTEGSNVKQKNQILCRRIVELRIRYRARGLINVSKNRLHARGLDIMPKELDITIEDHMSRLLKNLGRHHMRSGKI